MDPDVVAVTRHNPKTHESFILIAFTAFTYPDLNAGNYQRGIRPVRVEGVVDEIVFEATLSHTSVKYIKTRFFAFYFTNPNHCRSGGTKYTRFENYIEDKNYINGVEEYFVEIKEHLPITESQILEKVASGSENVAQLNFKNFKPGSVVAIKL